MSTSQVEEKETLWIDAWIRWERTSINETEGEDEWSDTSLPPPTECYNFQYEIPEKKGEETAIVNLELRGFPYDSEQIWNSTGLTLWPSSDFLCDYLVEMAKSKVDTFLPKSKESPVRIVELGTGLGRCGLLAHHIACHRYSASHVFLTDGDTDTLKQLRANADRNCQYELNSNHKVSCHQLLWGAESAKKFRMQHLGKQCPDLIVGTDLVYTPKAIEPLFETVRVILGAGASGASFVMVHSDRREGSSVNLPMVLKGAEAASLNYKILKSAEAQGNHLMVFSIKDTL